MSPPTQTSGTKDATSHTNRALCYLKLGQWQEAIEDCQQALQMDSGLIKGHFFMGQALVESGKYDDALVSLKTGKPTYYLGGPTAKPRSCVLIAHELAKQQQKNYGEDITAAIRYAKKMVSLRGGSLGWSLKMGLKGA